MLNDQEIEIENNVEPQRTTIRDITSPGLQLFLYEEDSSISMLAQDWLELVRKADATIYATPQWAECWWKYYGKNPQRSLYILTLWDGNKLAALAPFYQGKTKAFGYDIELRLQLIGSGGSPNEQLGYKDDYGVSDFLDIIVDPDYSEIASGIFAGWLREKSKDFAQITFHQLRDDSYIMNHLYPKLSNGPIPVDIVKTDTCPYIELNNIQKTENYIKTVKSNARRRLRQTIRAVHEDHHYKIEELNRPEDISKATETLIKMHQERWNEIGYPGLFHDKRFTLFFKELMDIAFSNNWLWFKQTADDDGVNSSRMILKFNGRFYDYVSGFDSNSSTSKYRPGFGLLLDLIDDAISEGISRVELLRGEEVYKYDFTDKQFNNWMVTIKNNKTKRFTARWFDAAALLYKYGVRERILLNIHCSNHGVMRGVGSYVNFRYQRVRSKLGE